MRHVRRQVGAGLCLALLLVAAPGFAQQIGYTGSVYAGRGTYGVDTGDRITSVYLFNSIDVASGPVRASVSVPFVTRWTRAAAGALDSSVAAAPSSSERVTGFGDPLIRADVNVLDDRTRGVRVGVAASVKLPVADAESGLGTGKADVGLGGTLFTSRGATSMFADLLFWKYGDPVGVEFPDTLSYGIGVGRVLGQGRWSAMASVAGFSRGFEGAPPPLQVYVTALRLISRTQSVAITAGIGLNDSADDFSVGASWRVSR